MYASDTAQTVGTSGRAKLQAVENKKILEMIEGELVEDVAALQSAYERLATFRDRIDGPAPEMNEINAERFPEMSGTIGRIRGLRRTIRSFIDRTNSLAESLEAIG